MFSSDYNFYYTILKIPNWKVATAECWVLSVYARVEVKNVIVEQLLLRVLQLSSTSHHFNSTVNSHYYILLEIMFII